MPWQDVELHQKDEELVSPEEIIPEGVYGLVKIDKERYNRRTYCGCVLAETEECMEVLMSCIKLDEWKLASSPNGDILSSVSSDGPVVCGSLSGMMRQQIVVKNCSLDGPTAALLGAQTASFCYRVVAAPDCPIVGPNGMIQSFFINLKLQASTELFHLRFFYGLCEKGFQHPEVAVTNFVGCHAKTSSEVEALPRLSFCGYNNLGISLTFAKMFSLCFFDVGYKRGLDCVQNKKE
ncbi:unnamed protein product [Peronospora belbahrii]|uniref:Uncharacterized protein n=1 Tax=Peronospora belbahrii TaxID=622444 RepID=A0AAU9KPG6_9STRA|nr:unnamed protein product [Peronospora belbahrii]